MNHQNNQRQASDMKRIKSHLLGIAQGQVDLFSDFATDGEMWTGNGPRERRQRVNFKERFQQTPTVHVSLSLWDMDSETNIRADVGAEEVGKAGFTIVFKTWGDSRIARVRMSWIAMGEAQDPDAWELE